MLKLESRPCKLGVYLNTPTQRHGDERVPAKVLGIKNILLTKEEFNELLGDDHAWDAFYIETKGKPSLPICPHTLGSFLVPGKFKGSAVSISFGLKPYEIELAEATCKSLKLDRQEGGLTALSLTVVCLKSNVSGDLARLDEFLDSDADVVLALGDPEDEDDVDDDEDSDQPGLDLDHSKSAATATDKPRRGRPPKLTPAGDVVN